MDQTNVSGGPVFETSTKAFMTEEMCGVIRQQMNEYASVIAGEDRVVIYRIHREDEGFD